MHDYGMPEKFAAPRDCGHRWESVSMVMETQFLDPHGRVNVRQPDTQRGRVYFICRRCASHTYMTTQWIGFRMLGSEDAIPPGQENSNGINRPAWEPDKEEENNA